MPTASLAQSLLLPELEILDVINAKGTGVVQLHVQKTSDFEVCPRCATPSKSVYDRRTVKVRDSGVRARRVFLFVRKRRFSCRPCRRPFTEPIKGIKKGCRTTERFERDIVWACQRFANISEVCRTYRCSQGYAYKSLYKQLHKRLQTFKRPWPKVIGIDEHAFSRNKKTRQTEFASIVVDYSSRSLLEVVEGKKRADLEAALQDIQGRERVHFAIMDMCDGFKGFAREFFPNATLIADKFHVLRLLSPAITRRRVQITGDRRSARIRRLLLRNRHKLRPIERFAVDEWLKAYPELAELYRAKESLHSFYRIRGQKRAATALTKLTDGLAHSGLPELKTLRRTLMRWRKEILAYFETRLTNARTEGFNNKAKVIKRRAYGYKSFRNYRLRLLNDCAPGRYR